MSTKVIERAEPRNPRRFSGKPIAITLAIVLVVGTGLTTYYAWQAEVVRQRAFDAAAAESSPSP